jgi:hypothetical protein
MGLLEALVVVDSIQTARRLPLNKKSVIPGMNKDKAIYFDKNKDKAILISNI